MTDDHQQQIDELRVRQLAIIQVLPPADALIVLAATPINSDEEHAIVADLQQRLLLHQHIDRQQEKP